MSDSSSSSSKSSSEFSSSHDASREVSVEKNSSAISDSVPSGHAAEPDSQTSQHEDSVAARSIVAAPIHHEDAPHVTTEVSKETITTTALPPTGGPLGVTATFGTADMASEISGNVQPGSSSTGEAVIQEQITTTTTKTFAASKPIITTSTAVPYTSTVQTTSTSGMPVYSSGTYLGNAGTSGMDVTVSKMSSVTTPSGGPVIVGDSIPNSWIRGSAMGGAAYFGSSSTTSGGGQHVFKSPGYFPGNPTVSSSNMMSTMTSTARSGHQWTGATSGPYSSVVTSSTPFGQQTVQSERVLASNITSEQYLHEFPLEENVQIVEVPIYEEVIRTVQRKEFVEIEKRVPRYETEYVEKIVEVPEVRIVEKLVEVTIPQEVPVHVPVRQVVEVPREVVVKVPRIETRIVEKTVEVPGEIIEVPKPYLVENKVVIPRYSDREVATVVAQRLVPVLSESTTDFVDVDLKTYNPRLVPVDVYVPRLVSRQLVAASKAEEHRVVDVPIAQFNSLVRQVNSHIVEKDLEGLLIREANGGIPMMPFGPGTMLVQPQSDEWMAHHVKGSQRWSHSAHVGTASAGGMYVTSGGAMGGGQVSTSGGGTYTTSSAIGGGRLISGQKFTSTTLGGGTTSTSGVSHLMYPGQTIMSQSGHAGGVSHLTYPSFQSTGIPSTQTNYTTQTNYMGYPTIMSGNSNQVTYSSGPATLSSSKVITSGQTTTAGGLVAGVAKAAMAGIHQISGAVNAALGNSQQQQTTTTTTVSQQPSQQRTTTTVYSQQRHNSTSGQPQTPGQGPVAPAHQQPQLQSVY